MTLDEALQLLKEDKTNEFMELARPLASAVLTPNPWLHAWTLRTDAENLNQCQQCGAQFSFSPTLFQWIVEHKVTYGESVRVLTETELGCPVPPPLAGSAADIAFRLRDAYSAACRRDSRLTRSLTDVRGAGRIFLECCHDDTLGLSEWLLWYATPYEQIAVCLEALGQLGEHDRAQPPSFPDDSKLPQFKDIIGLFAD